MQWYMWLMDAPPLFGGDRLYNAIVAFVVLLVGAGIYFKTGNKLGWIFIAGALVWVYITFKDYIEM